VKQYFLSTLTLALYLGFSCLLFIDEVFEQLDALHWSQLTVLSSVTSQ